MLIDLHTHSTCSDGTQTPTELIASAERAGLNVIALTDHDNTGGWAEAEAALPTGLTLVRGAEFSTVVRADNGRPTSVHLLGYLFDPQSPTIVAEQARLRAERLGRGLAIVDLMVDDGITISREQVLEFADGAPIGRPHIARALIAVGVVDTVNQAFEHFLAGNSKYYVSKVDTELNRAITMIAEAGGVSVVAHSRSRAAARVLTAARFAELAALGLNGIEVDHPEHHAEARRELAGIAAELRLIPTGSSDFHGTNKTLVLGQELTSADSLERIVAASSGAVPLARQGVSR